MKDRAIISVVAGDHHRHLQRRTYSQCQKFCIEADLRFSGVPEPWQYEMKLDAFAQAPQQYRIWMDVTFQPVASIMPLWDYIADCGWFIPRQGNSMLWNWVSDEALEIYGISRRTAREIPLCLSGLIGFDMGSSIGQAIMSRWCALRKSFVGVHYNKPGEQQARFGNKFTGHVSDDPMVQGHRHDESALSYVLWEMGLEPLHSRFLEIDQTEGYIIGRNMQRENGTYAE